MVSTETSDKIIFLPVLTTEHSTVRTLVHIVHNYRIYTSVVEQQGVIRRYQRCVELRLTMWCGVRSAPVET